MSTSLYQWESPDNKAIVIIEWCEDRMFVTLMFSAFQRQFGVKNK